MSLYDDLYSTDKEGSDERYELTTGIVMSNYDENFKGMVKVSLDYFDKTANESEWLPVATSYAGQGYGSYFLPETDDQVLVAYINGDPHSGVVIASLWNTKNTRPDGVVTEENTVKKIITKAGHQIYFDDEKGKGGIHIQTTKELQIQILDENEVIEVKDKDGKNIITIDSKNGKIEIKAEKEIHINGGSNVPVKIDGSDITIKGKNIVLDAASALKAKGNQVNIEGQTLAGKGNASVNVETGGKLTLKGSITQIN